MPNHAIFTGLPLAKSLAEARLYGGYILALVAAAIARVARDGLEPEEELDTRSNPA
jgi:hypothetical protein